jgi:hypothetical protein
MANMILGLDLDMAGGKVADKYSLANQYITPAMRQKTVSK